MLIIEDFSSGYNDPLEHYWNFKGLESLNDQTVFLNGWAIVENSHHYKEKYKHYKNKFFLEPCQPCIFQSTDKHLIGESSNIDNYFDKVFTFCPYTADWLNKIRGDDCFEEIFFPFNKEHLVENKEEKIYDALYWGGLHSTMHLDILDAIKNYNFNFFTLGVPYWTIKDINYSKYITYTNIPRRAMWSVLRKTKVNVIVNLLFTNEQINNNIRSIPKWEDNIAFSRLDEYIMPQIKTRAIESAANRVLMVVKKDPWNIIERWFKPDIDFVYYESKEELKEILSDVSKNWSSYEHIVENAYNKLVDSYTSDHFIEKMERSII
tara:strand:- start:117 stop:1079 length:963 start_codon:yes stop_codon:yes gene_type:complete